MKTGMNEVSAKLYKAGIYLMKFLLLAPFLLTLSTVFIIDSRLANGVVSGKYFWFYGSMGLVSIATLIYSLPLYPLKGTLSQSFRFSLTDVFALLFTGSVFLSAFLFGDISANTTKLTLLALLLVLYFCLRIITTPTTPQPPEGGENKSPLGVSGGWGVVIILRQKYKTNSKANKVSLVVFAEKSPNSQADRKTLPEKRSTNMSVIENLKGLWIDGMKDWIRVTIVTNAMLP